MLGPYYRGLGKRKANSDYERDTDEEKSEIAFSRPEEQHSTNMKSRRYTQLDAGIISKFDPGKKSTNVKGWLHKIDQLGDLYDWDERDRIFVMQIRLRGAAREWYDDLDDYSSSWILWKEKLEKAFPRSTDFIDRLEEMVARRKNDNETMTKYYHDKMSLLRKCNIEGDSASSCLIRGLPIELQANAKAFCCDSPEELYYGFLSSLENYKQVELRMAEHGSLWRRGNIGPPRLCYSCRKTGHEARDCCFAHCQVCHRPGHTSADCWFAPGPSSHSPPPPSQPQLTQQYQKFGDKGSRETRPMSDGRVLQPHQRPASWTRDDGVK